jgi:hypothetical protein
MRRLLFLAATTLVLAACSGGGGSPPPPPPPTTGDFRITNSSSASMNEVYVSESTNLSWGPQRNSAAVAPGGSFIVPSLAPGLWDFEGVNWGSLSDYYTDAWNQTVAAGSTTQVTVYNTSFSGSLQVYNGDSAYAYSIVNLYVSPSTSSSWGADQLGVDPIAYGWTYDLQGLPPGYYDVWCEFSDGYDEYAFDVLVSSLSATTVTCNGI